MADAKQAAFDGNQLILRRGTPAPPPTDSLAFITTPDGLGVQLQTPAGALSAMSRRPKRGSDLTDADATINPATDQVGEYVLPGPLTASRVLTLGVGGSPITGHMVQITVLDTSANTYTVKDSAAATLFTFAASPGAGVIRQAWFSFVVGTGKYAYFPAFLYLQP